MTRIAVLEGYIQEVKTLLEENEYIEVMGGDFLLTWLDRIEKYRPMTYDSGITKFRELLNKLSEDGFCTKTKASHGSYRYKINTDGE